MTLSLAMLWSIAAVRYSQWLERGGEKAKKWKESYGKLNTFQAALQPWVLENGILLSMATICSRVFPPRSKKGFFTTLMLHVLRSMVITEGSWLVLTLCAKKMYAGIPWFSSHERMPRPAWSEFLQSWARLMIPLRLLNAVNEAQELQTATAAEYSLIAHGPSSGGLLSFLLQFAVIRSLHDLGFYFGHWLIHHPKLYSWIHKRHHEHKEPTILTNSHFWMLDLFIEAGVPLIAALHGVFLFRKAGFQFSNFELSYTICSMIWYENGSHAGKQLPCVTVCPPLSFIPWIDQVFGGGVAHHHQHHRRSQSNYSIAAWPDRAFGTWEPLSNETSLKQDM
eukprot:TRINITY_DN25910_c0_g1_i1.p1 TRINITY_DN25910_c0_g1~~TRINITY_DN25910_c0_g1_i1.p1  ORF type:complete len:371 (+),score=15.78 TRINITY_DN25910_c0_g1_i1:103-1113(+)